MIDQKPRVFRKPGKTSHDIFGEGWSLCGSHKDAPIFFIDNSSNIKQMEQVLFNEKLYRDI